MGIRRKKQIYSIKGVFFQGDLSLLACLELRELIAACDDEENISADTMRCFTDKRRLHRDTTLAGAAWDLYRAKLIDLLRIDDPEYQ